MLEKKKTKLDIHQSITTHSKNADMLYMSFQLREPSITEHMGLNQDQ